jgi:hypothetical protein
MIGIEPTSTALAMAIVNLYSADDNGHFKDANLGGILCFVVDRKLKSRFFRLYDMNTSELLFQSELYVNISENYRALRDKFYCFSLNKTIVAFQFANLHDAMYFKKLVDQFSFVGDPK